MTPASCSLTLQSGEHAVLVSVIQETRSDLGTVTLRREGEHLRVLLTPTRPVTVGSLRVNLPLEIDPADRIFLNGYQSWTDSREFAPRERMRGLRGVPKGLIRRYGLDRSGDYLFTDYPGRPGQLHGYSYGYLRRGERYRLFASCSERNGFTCFQTDARQGTVTAKKETCGRIYPAGETVTLLELFLAEGGENDVFDRWFAALGLPRPSAPPVTGYTSWYRHYQDIDEAKLRADLRGVCAGTFPFEIVQIDDGWEESVGDWLPHPEKFPRGMRAVRDEIAAAGKTPGLWLAPFVCQRDARIAREHPDWFQRDAAGNFLSGGGNWGGMYVLDWKLPAARDYVRQVVQTAVHDWDFAFLKLDFLYAACLYPAPGETRGERMCQAMDFLRSCAGEARLLGCGVPLMPAFGRVDYCRIGCDVGLSWDDKPWMRLLHRERISTKNSLQNSVFRRQLNGRAFVNDPDVFLLRRDGNTLLERQRQALAEVNALCGGVLFTSDNPASYDAGQTAQLRRLLTLRQADVLNASRDGGALTLRFRGENGEETLKIPL